MKAENIKILIDGKQITQRDMDVWKKQRIKKAYKTLHIKIPQNVTLSKMGDKLTKVKVQLSDDEIREILRKKLFLSRFVMKIASLLSGKKRRVARTTIVAKGITVEKFSQMLDSLMVEATEENRNVNLSVYPEHYLLTPDKNGVLEVIETTGNAPIPVQFFITFGDENGLTEPKNPKFTHQSAGVAKLEDGTIIGGVRHQFRNISAGIECRLAVEFPGLCPNVIVKAHQKHLAVEFTNWLNWIIENQSMSSENRFPNGNGRNTIG
ncbi:MAG: hypothetical protein Q4D16_02995 [Eubacteriales bacterium]|nr:hypothetical protein [Eubacteriales bacterium]